MRIAKPSGTMPADDAHYGTAFTRALALFIGLFWLASLIASFAGSSGNQNLWWIDFTRAQSLAGAYAPIVNILQVVTAALLIIWAIHPNLTAFFGIGLRVLCLLTAVVAFSNALDYWQALLSKELHAGLPLPLSFLIGLLLLWLARAVRHQYPRKHSAWVTICGMLAWLLALVLVVPLTQIVFFGTTDYRRPADAAVVFGAQVYDNGTLSPALKERVDTAIDLYEEGYAPVLIMSGGTGINYINEGDAMRAYAIEQGVPADAIIVDRSGMSTEESVVDSLEIARTHGYDSVIATSSFYHLPRIKMLYIAQQTDVLTVPTIGNITNNGTFSALWREIGAWWYYWIKSLL